MTKEQREAVERLRGEFPGRYNEHNSRIANDILMLLDLLTPPDDDRRAMVVWVPRPDETGCGNVHGQCPLHDGEFEMCRASCGKVRTDKGYPELFPGEGCSWHDKGK